ncbi:hypothetical protein Scep_002198 [Stephania cephalantha]|uniref:Uncharacterized protein n=1 Tax=Stephania cephalantha TaxID=152367 RepID=A0AAP0L9H6_9MAGN
MLSLSLSCSPLFFSMVHMDLVSMDQWRIDDEEERTEGMLVLLEINWWLRPILSLIRDLKPQLNGGGWRSPLEGSQRIKVWSNGFENELATSVGPPLFYFHKEFTLAGYFIACLWHARPKHVYQESSVNNDPSYFVDTCVGVSWIYIGHQEDQVIGQLGAPSRGIMGRESKEWFSLTGMGTHICAQLPMGGSNTNIVKKCEPNLAKLRGCFSASGARQTFITPTKIQEIKLGVLLNIKN